MLVGQHFGRRHDDRLVSGGNRDEDRIDGNSRLPGSHVGLQQAVHRVAGRQIFADFAYRLALSLGENEGKQASNPRVDLGRRRQDRGGPARVFQLRRLKASPS